jgi:kinetochore protein NNF1
LYTAHIHPYLEQATGELDSRLQSSRQDNAAMMDKINAQRAEMEQLLNDLEGVIEDIDGSVAAMRTNEQGPFIHELKSDVWQMEQEVAATTRS